MSSISGSQSDLTAGFQGSGFRVGLKCAGNPCQHHVEFEGGSCRGTLGAAMIVALFQRTDTPLPEHFEKKEEVDEFNTKGTAFVVGDGCLESYPCQHSVKFADSSSKTLSAVDICGLFKGAGVAVPRHFSYVASIPSRAKTQFLTDDDYTTE